MAAPRTATRAPREEPRHDGAEPSADPARELLRAGGAGAGLPLFAQGKLVLDTPGDAHEREADAVAQRAAVGGGSGAGTTPPPAPGTVSGGDAQLVPPTSGAPLSPAVRAAVEPAVGADLRHVRVHGDHEARETASALQARAFTSGRDIWLGPGERADDVELMAHEATHVVQQGRAGDVRRTRVQRKAAPRTNDGAALVGSMNAELEKAKRKAGKEGGDKPQPKPGEKPRIDPAEKAARKAELRPKAKLRDRAGEARPKVERAARDTKAEAAKPTEKKKGSEKGGKGKGGDKGAPGAAQAGAARQAFAAASAVTAPPMPRAVTPPKPVLPVDAGGKSLPADPRSESRVLMLAGAAQQLRLQAMALRARAADERANAAILRGNIALAQSHVADSDNSVGTVLGHVAYRREVEGKAKGVHELSEQKADMVAAEAPQYASRSADGERDTGPMASDSAELAGEAAATQPDDEEAAADAKEQSGQLSSASGDLGSIDGAMTQTRGRAESLGKDAAKAKQQNVQSKQQIDATDATLARTDAKLADMKGKNAAARARLGGLAGAPAQHAAAAGALDQEAASLVQASEDLEARLHRAQQRHAQGMASVPASKIAPRRPAAAANGRTVPVQRRVAGTPEKADLAWGGAIGEALPSWVTGEERRSEAQRQDAAQREKKRREDEIAEIEASAEGGFEKLSATDKMGIALSLTGRHLWRDISSTNWANFGGQLLRGFVDPRVSLMGIVGGLSMTLSGFGTIYRQWDRDPLGAVLTGAAQIATGVTLVLGSIAGLALSIAVILTAIAIIGSIFSFGAVGAALAPIIAFCGTVASTVGGWAITAAIVALVLNGLVFIKNLIDAATAGTAAELQQNADVMTEDAKNMGNMALQLGMARVTQVGGKALANTRFAQAAGNRWGAMKQAAGLEPPAPGGGGAAAAAPEPPTGAGAPDPVPSAGAADAPAPGGVKPGEAPAEVPARKVPDAPEQAPDAPEKLSDAPENAPDAPEKPIDAPEKPIDAPEKQPDAPEQPGDKGADGSAKKPNDALERQLDDLKQRKAANERRLEELRTDLERNRALEREGKLDPWRARTERDIINAERAGLAADNAKLAAAANRVDLQLNPQTGKSLPCFAAGTLVWTDAGPRPIGDLRPGDMVCCFDFERHETTSRPVLATFRNRTSHFYDVTVSGATIQATGAHRFWVDEELRWIPARALAPGMTVRAIDQPTATIDAVQLRDGLSDDSFNLAVDEFPNYFVGTGVLVHNEGEAVYQFGDGVVYEGVNPDPKFAGKVYIGQTDAGRLDSGRRQSEHRAEARRMLKDTAGMTPQQIEYWEFKSQIELRARVRGLDPAQTNYMEQVNIDNEIQIRGKDLMNPKKVQVSASNMKLLEAQIASDPAVRKAGLCPP